MISFEDYLCNRNDAIDNAAYQLICAMTAQDHNELKEWMAVIADLSFYRVDSALYNIGNHLIVPLRNR